MGKPSTLKNKEKQGNVMRNNHMYFRAYKGK